MCSTIPAHLLLTNNVASRKKAYFPVEFVMPLIARFVSIFVLVISPALWSLAVAEPTGQTSDPVVYTEPKVLLMKQMINLAGRQRMLSQRIVKLYCQIGLDVFSKESYLALLEDVDRFENQYTILKNYSDDPVYQEILEWVDIAWSRFKPLVTEPVMRDKLLRINRLAEDLLYTSDQVAIFLQDSSDQREEMLVNISGRQRMFAQRLGKLYLMKSWGFDRWSVNNEMKRIRQQYALTLIRLRNAPENTPEIRDSLKEVNQQWIRFKSALERVDESSYRPVVANASDELMQMMESITGKYAEFNE